MKLPALLIAILALIATPSAKASTVDPTDPAAGGVGYKFTVTMSGSDSAVYDGHVGAWSWDENAATPGDPTFGWTHTSLWTALELTESAYLTVRLARKADVPWPSANDPSRKAGTDAMFPSFTIYRNWDNDAAPTNTTSSGHQYNGRGNIGWAEDLSYLAHVDNSTTEFVERTYALLPGKYTIVQGSNAIENNAAVRQGFGAALTTSPYAAPSIKDDSYFTLNHVQPFTVDVNGGILANDANMETGYTLQVVSQPSRGTVAVAANGSFTYTPGAYYGVSGLDTFTYKMVPSDSILPEVGPATVAITSASAAAGQYTGLLLEGGNGAPGGLVKLSVSKTGVYTGTASVAGKGYTVKGKFDTAGKTAPKLKPTLAGVELSLATLGDGRRHVSATLPKGETAWIGEIEQSPYSQTQSAPMVGTHKVTLVPATTGDTLPPAIGRATLRITKTGDAKLVGKLGDATPFSISTGLIVGIETGPTLPIYAGLYKGLTGKMSGKMTFGASAEADATGVITVVKPEQSKGAFKEGFTLDYNASTATP